MTSAPSPTRAYCDDLLLALRAREVPGSRIGEILAEVESHVAETGESPRTAFGPPREYADEVADALGLPRTSLLGFLRRSLRWSDLVVSIVQGLTCFVLADGLWSLGAGSTGVFGLPAGPTTAVAAGLLVAGALRTVRSAREDRDTDAIIDPRTGADVTPVPGWRLALLLLVPALMLAGMFVGGLLTR
jgi:hypothetical protein